ncbi:hypothetical protein CCH79_00020530 [Gambusia affinis]|uniref:Uncharacterized protein n=1 Tax=Gambusia affinis TaxID=33528 RepID=A0A315UWE9_GAMAF|nr:hypothetical protein CCH79_00020530 [Gambusia affinis]
MDEEEHMFTFKMKQIDDVQIYDTKMKGVMVDSGTTKHIVADAAKFKDFNLTFKPQSHILELTDGVRASGTEERHRQSLLERQQWPNCGDDTIPVAQGQSSLAPMELPDSGLAYPLWAQPLTTISAMPNPGVQFASGSAALPGPPLVHMPLPMSLTAMISQPETQVVDPHPQIRDTQQHSGHELDQEPQDHSLAENPEEEPVSPNLLDKLLEDQKRHDEEEDKNSYSSSILVPVVYKNKMLTTCLVSLENVEQEALNLLPCLVWSKPICSSSLAKLHPSSTFSS